MNPHNKVKFRHTFRARNPNFNLPSLVIGKPPPSYALIRRLFGACLNEDEILPVSLAL